MTIYNLFYSLTVVGLRREINLSFILLIISLGVSNITSSGGFTVVLANGGESITVLDRNRESVFSVDADYGERLSYVCFGDLKLFFISSCRGLVQTDIITGESVVLNEGQTGAPWLSSTGDLWYTVQGVLYENGLSTGAAIPAFSVSVENDIAVFTNRADELIILSLVTGEMKAIPGYRFYSPVVLPNGDVFASSLGGEIIFVSSGGNPVVLANGSQPCWSDEYSGLFYCVTEDDGHSLLSADIWFVRPLESPVRITGTFDVLETNPSYSDGLLWYIDERTGISNFVDMTDVSL